MTNTLNIYVFTSSSLANIWAGVGAEMWAVAPAEEGSAHSKGRVTKARKMPIGALGILYSSVDRALTAPFIVRSKPDEAAVVEHVWQEKWVLPFRILPFGSPHKRLKIDEAKQCLPSFIQSPEMPFNHLFRVRADFAFQMSQITTADWSVLIEKLANDAQTH